LKHTRLQWITKNLNKSGRETLPEKMMLAKMRTSRTHRSTKQTRNRDVTHQSIMTKKRVKTRKKKATKVRLMDLMPGECLISHRLETQRVEPVRDRLLATPFKTQMNT